MTWQAKACRLELPAQDTDRDSVEQFRLVIEPTADGHPDNRVALGS